MNRIAQISNKLLFCIKICADISSFVKLVLNSKKFDRYQRSQSTSFPNSNKETAEIYRLKTDIKRSVHMRTMAGDLQMFYEVFLEAAYKVAVAKKKHRLTIIDAGSNIGLSALYFLREFEVAKMICIEPDPSNFELLHQNLKGEIASGKVSVIRTALSDRDGTAEWLQSPRSYNNRLQGQADLTNAKTSNTPSLQVSTATLNTLIRSENLSKIDLIKIDIEGAEKLVFMNDLSWLNITQNLVIEIHYTEEVNTIASILTEHGFNVRKLNNNYSEVYWATKDQTPTLIS